MQDLTVVRKFLNIVYISVPRFGFVFLVTILIRSIQIMSLTLTVLATGIIPSDIDSLSVVIPACVGTNWSPKYICLKRS